ncbi:glycosyltransferase [Citreimonas sp.]|uniref:glycosyltransferase n=1 Tax=Citreimonas sp. TaxID=3036715 RepID=UPI00405A161C
MTTRPPHLSVIVPASNEARHIGACLDALAAARWDAARPAEVVVVVNGSRDETAAIARDKSDALARVGVPLRVIERAEALKIGALNGGDAAARGAARLYLDADVVVSRDLPVQIMDALQGEAPRFASGTVRITGDGTAARAYARLWRRLPFMRAGVPGCGLYAVNAAGRARWGAFPDIIADDLFARLSFRPGERVAVPATYDWPVAEGWRALVRVRRRQNAGVAEIARRYPDLMRNEDKAPLSRAAALGLGLRDPVGFGTYASVALAVRLTRGRRDGWSRGR